MKVTKLNTGFFKLGNDEYRVEAPMKMPNETVLEDFTDAEGIKRQRYVTVKTGKKLRNAGMANEPEPTVWHLYKMKPSSATASRG